MSDDALILRTVEETEPLNNKRGVTYRVQVVGGGGGGGAVDSVNGKTGAVVLNAKDVAAVPQYTTMPTADSTNVGNIVQFAGNQPTVPASATISQTTGSGLTDLAVDVATFESAEQPTGDETVAFTASVTPDTSVVVEATQGLDYTFDGAQVIDFFNSIWGYHDPNMDTYVWGIVYAVYTGGGNAGWVLSRNQDGSDDWSIVLPTGITINSTPTLGDYIEINNTMGGTTWTKDGNTVTLGDYGVSFTGNPTDGDVLTVAYTAEITGYDTGYFYVNKPTYSDSSATISQTTGSGLTDLAVDVATFESAEQPSGDENVAFTAVVIPENVTYSKNTVSDPNNYMLSRVVGWTGSKQDFNIQIETADENGNAQGLILGPTGGGIWLQITQQEMIDNNVSITNVSTSEVIFATYIAGSTSWTKGGSTVTLADYGISFTGDPADGDVLTVAYTASAISGYVWEQIDVQPSSGGGQTIEYTDVDYVYGTDPSEMSLYFEFENLPTGDYYFYLKSKKQVGSWSGSSYKYQTNKISFHWDSTWQDSVNLYDLCRLIWVTPVLDGDYYGGTDGENMFNNTSSPINVYYVGDNSNKYALKLNSGGLRAATSSVSEDMSAAYKVSKLYGGATPATLTANKIGRWDTPTGYNGYGDGGNTTPIIRPTTLPDKQAQQTYTVSTLGQTDNILVISGAKIATNSSAEAIVQLKCSCEYGEFIGDVIYTPNGEAAQQILKATGPFANSRLYAYMDNDYGNVYLSLDNAAFAALQNQNANVRVYTAIFGSVGGYDTSPVITQDQNLVSKATLLPLATSKPTYVMNTPAIHEYKGIVQYVGETDANYTNGYFYEADGTVVTVSAGLTCTETTSTGTTITCTGSDAEGLVNKLSSIIGWTPDDTKRMLSDSNYLWTTNGDSVNPELSWTAYSTWYGQDATDILAYFTFSPTLSTTVSWTTSNYQDKHDELQNGAWVQKDVQPSELPSVTGLADGNYKLRLTISSGVPTLSWVAE